MDSQESSSSSVRFSEEPFQLGERIAAAPGFGMEHAMAVWTERNEQFENFIQRQVPSLFRIALKRWIVVDLHDVGIHFSWG
jgi:hypothetical protein